MLDSFFALLILGRTFNILYRLLVSNTWQRGATEEEAGGTLLLPNVLPLLPQAMLSPRSSSSLSLLLSVLPLLLQLLSMLSLLLSLLPLQEISWPTILTPAGKVILPLHDTPRRGAL